MKEIILDTLKDTLILIPFLFIAFLIIEIIEHKLNKKSKEAISKSGKFGPLFGSLVGLIPQCGFGAIATNLFSTRVITLGTLISVYLTTSDEMLIILITEGIKWKSILTILGIKFIIGLICGYIIDIFFKTKEKTKQDYHICEEEHCHCEESIIKSSIFHTIKIIIFIAIITLILNIILDYKGAEFLNKILLKETYFSSFIASLIGLIPNCASSVIITELYINNHIYLSTTIAGLLTNCGVSLLILFKQNKNLKENIKIVSIIYIVGVLSGIILKIFGL